MLHILDNQTSSAIAEPAVVRSAFLSVIIHGSVLLFLLSLAFSPAVQSLPDRLNLTRLVVSLPPPPPPPAPPASAAAAKVPAVRTPRAFSKITAPAVIPNHTPAPNAIIDAPPEIALAGVPGGIPGGLPGGVMGGILSEIPGIQFAPAPIAAPPEVKVAPRSEPQRIQVDAEVQEAMLVEMVQPAYPVAAKITRMTGTVRLKAIINTEGRVAQLQIVEGPPLLAAAARTAVEKWRYRPTILNGAPVEVATNIIVHFRLT